MAQRPPTTVDFGFRAVKPGEKAGLVRAVFDRVAPRYDLMNDLMSLGVHRLWKRIFVTDLRPSPRDTLLDLAGGTGDISLGWLQTRRRPGAFDRHQQRDAFGRPRSCPGAWLRRRHQPGGRGCREIAVPGSLRRSRFHRLRSAQLHRQARRSLRGSAGAQAWRSIHVPGVFPGQRCRPGRDLRRLVVPGAATPGPQGGAETRPATGTWSRVSAPSPISRLWPTMMKEAGLARVNVRNLSGGHRRDPFRLAAVTGAE